MSRPDGGLVGLASSTAARLAFAAGDRIVLLDNRGSEFVTEVRRIGRTESSGLVLEQALCMGDPQVHVTLYQCALKTDKFEWVLQKGTEMGMSGFVPVVSERTVVRPPAALDGKAARWQSIVREAAEQCGRGRIPAVATALGWEEAVHAAAVCDCCCGKRTPAGAGWPLYWQGNVLRRRSA